MMSEASVDVPALLPARMLNEFTYCPRLFYLEWVQGQFVDNDDTVDGRFAHRHADRPAGTPPEVDDDVDRWVARALSLSSTELGIVAKLDVVEGRDGAVRPVERKRGSAPDNAERSWEPERVQVCAQGLLLREHGWRSDEGVLAFADSKERVVVPFDDELVHRTLELLTEARAVAAAGQAPAPFVDSPKCPRCSLVGICLPDETNALASRAEFSKARLMARDSPARPLYVTEPGAVVGRDGGRLVVRKKGETLGDMRLIDVSQVNVVGNVQVSTPLLRELFLREVPVSWFSFGGWFTGMATGLPSRHVELRRRQVAVAAHGGLEIARRIVEGKIRNSRILLRRNARSDVAVAVARLGEGSKQARSAATSGELLGVEGAAARTYFENLPLMLRDEHRLPGSPFAWDGRNRRPPRDAVNCLLSYVYALLVKDLTVTCHAVGLDPYLGVYHRPRFGRPAMALDLAEEFRPLVGDSTVLTLVNNGEVDADDFVVRMGGVALTASGRRAVIGAYERRLDTEIRHPLFGYRASYRRVLELQVRLMAAHILGEAPAYVPFVTR